MDIEPAPCGSSIESSYPFVNIYTNIEIYEYTYTYICTAHSLSDRSPQLVSYVETFFGSVVPNTKCWFQVEMMMHGG
jgi:hypothetical protein